MPNKDEENLLEDEGFGLDEGFEDTEEIPASDEFVEKELTDVSPEGVESDLESVSNILTASTTDMPELEGKQPGDTVRATIDMTISKINEDGSYDLEVNSFIPAEKAAMEEPLLPEAPAGGGGAPGEGAPATDAIASLLGG